jgi:hypothetical protein
MQSNNVLKALLYEISYAAFIKYNYLEYITMISPKLGVLMAAMAVIGAAGALPMAPMALAQDQESEVEIERNNEISQSIEQSQEACTNEAQVSVSDDDEFDIGGENEIEVFQGNFCIVEQSQSGTNTAVIVDESTNDIEASLAQICLRCVFPIRD